MEEEKLLTDEEFQKLADERTVTIDKPVLTDKDTIKTIDPHKPLPEDEGTIEILDPLKILYKDSDHLVSPPVLIDEQPLPQFSNREIKYHRVVSNKPEKLIITANAPNDPGGAPDGYMITHIETSQRIAIDFQTLVVKDGVTNEALLAIIEDRLICWQAGPYKSHFNAVALECIETALTALKERTLARIARGVEGMEIP